MIEEVIVDLLQDNGFKVYPDSVPIVGGAYPCVVYQRISTPQIRTHAGNALQYPRFQFSCYGKGETGKSDALVTAQALKALLDLNQTDFILATKEGELDIEEIEPLMFRRILDFYIWSDAE